MRILTSCVIMAGILVWPGMAAAINFNNGVWATSFDYSSACSMSGAAGGVNCDNVQNDGINWGRSNPSLGGKYTEAVTAANNPNGAGGMGARFWVEDGTNRGTSSVRLSFGAAGPKPEIWLRWYQRYEAGFSYGGGNPNYDKTFYMYTNNGISASTLEILPEHASGRFGLQAQGGGTGDLLSSPPMSWKDVFGTTSDGLFHMFEVHIKMDTNSTNGIGRMWIDGNLVVDRTDVDWSGGKTQIRADGIYFMDFHSNQASPANGGPAYVDYDDLAIYTVTPPNTDAAGNPWIGPINGYLGAGSLPRPKSPAPVGVSFFDPIEDSNFASRGLVRQNERGAGKFGGDVKVARNRSNTYSILALPNKP